VKILHVTDRMNPKQGGVCQAIRTMIQGLDSHHIQNEVVCLDDSKEAFLQDDPFVIHALGPAENAWSYSNELLPWLVEHMERYTVVIVHGLWQYPGHAVFKAKKRLLGKSLSKDSKGPKFFVMPHGMLDPYFQNAPDRKLKALRNTLYWKLIEKRLVNTVRGLLFTCEEEKNLACIPFRPYRPKSESVVGLGVQQPPPFEFEMEDKFLDHCPRLKGKNYFLFLSRIHEKKGVDLLIEAYSKLLRNNEQNKISDEKIPKLVVAGPGIESDYGKKILKMVAQMPFLKNHVFFPGMLSGPLKWGAFYGSEAFILPSHQENFGIAIVEALACEKPVLISNKINIWREIEFEGGGIVDEDNVSGTYRLLESWVKMSVTNRKTMNESAKELYARYFSVDQAAENLLSVLNSNQHV